MRADASHAGAMRVVGRTADRTDVVHEPAVPYRRSIYIDYGKPPRGRSAGQAFAVLAVAALFLLVLRSGLL